MTLSVNFMHFIPAPIRLSFACLLVGLLGCSQQAQKPAAASRLSAPAQAISATSEAFVQPATSQTQETPHTQAAAHTHVTAQPQASPAANSGWQSFASAGLNQLLAQAFSNSPDLAAASARLEQAQARNAAARASLWPQAWLNASSGKSRFEPADGRATSSADSRASVGLSYDLDLFGAQRAGRQAAQANLAASQYRNQLDQLELQLAVAEAWFTHLALSERYTTQTQNLAIARQIDQLVEARFRAGAVSAADRSQQRTNLLAQEAALLPLQAQRQANLAALAVLVGAAPQTFNPSAEPLAQLQVPALSADWPAQVLSQRPDIAALEAQLAAADADIRQTRAAFFPSLSLSAAASLSSDELFKLSPATQGLNWSLSLAQSLFDGGSRRAQQDLALSLRAELLETYRKAVLNALAQTQTALSNSATNDQQEHQQQALVFEARRSLELTQARYRAGRGDLQSLLDAQRSLFSAEDNLQQKRQARVLGVLEMVRALGGWPEGG